MYPIQTSLVDLPALTTAQMIEVDRAMIDDYHIELARMMENAGRSLAELARLRFLDSDPRGKRVIILAGSGGNGGGALVCARRLYNWGSQVRVFLAKPAESFTGVPAHQLDILHRLGLPTTHDLPAQEDHQADLVIDGLIGYSLEGPPRQALAQLIDWANAQTAPTLALDIPSGLDATLGVRYTPIVAASATLTLALPKRGLLLAEAAPYVGELYLADIGVPAQLYQSPALDLQVGPIFAAAEILRLR